jgi:hypothetical protein
MRDAAIALNAAVPEPIRAFVAERMEPVFGDVRRLLALPREAGGRGFEGTAAPALLSLVGALSRVFFPTVTGERAAFLAVAERYPTIDEPAHAVKDPKAFAEGLYAHYQAAVVHGLGLHMKRDGRYEPWRLAPVKFAGRDVRLGVERLRALSVGDAVLAGLDAPSGWPTGVGPTLSLTTDALRLEVDALYCGTRRLVRSLTEDGSLQAGACAMLQSWHAELLQRDAHTAASLLAAGASVGTGAGAATGAVRRSLEPVPATGPGSGRYATGNR